MSNEPTYVLPDIPVYPVEAEGHTHWTWHCPKTTGGCGYHTPFFDPDEHTAEDGYTAHLTNCRAGQSSPSAP